MSMHRSLAAALWLLAAAGGYAMALSWADAAQTGNLHPWVLIVVFWAAAAASAAIHHLSRYLADQLAQLPEAQHAPMLRALRRMTNAERADLSVLAQRVPPQDRADLVRALLSTADDRRGAWLQMRLAQ